jgi:hypothetical protein
VNENEAILTLFENVDRRDEIVIRDTAKRLLLDEQELVSFAVDFAGRGLLDNARPGAYRPTELGRTKHDSIRASILRAERAAVVRRNPPWG